MTISLSEWDAKIGRHLHYIEAGAEMCARHVSQLIWRPEFETYTLDDLSHVEHCLTLALTKVRKAQADYVAKESGS
jgi:hypothetical protein